MADTISTQQNETISFQINEKLFRSIVETAQQGIWVINQEAKTMYVNKKMANMLGFTVEEMLGKSVFIFLNEEAQATVKAKLEQRQKGVSEQYELNFSKKDGSLLPTILNATPLKDDTSYLGSFAIITDITEQKNTEIALRRSEERFRTAIENLLDGFAIFSTVRENGIIIDFRYEYINDMGCKLNQKTKEEVIGHTLLELLPAHKESGLFDEYVKVVETGIPLRKESYAYEDVYAGIRLQRAFDFQAIKLGHGFIVTWREVTERKKSEDELKKQKEELEKLNNLMIGRELKMEELKKELQQLKGSLPQQVKEG